MTIINFFCAAVLVGCLTSWVWCFVNKWEVSEGCSIAQWLEIHGGRFVGGVARCSFCFNWWLSWAVVIPAAVVTGEWWPLVLVPFCSTTIGRLLSN